jgi:hypothetical protein
VRQPSPGPQGHSARLPPAQLYRRAEAQAGPELVLGQERERVAKEWEPDAFEGLSSGLTCERYIGQTKEES